MGADYIKSYEDGSEFHTGDRTEVYSEGRPSLAAKSRYARLNECLGQQQYLEGLLKSLYSSGFEEQLSDEKRGLIDALCGGVTNAAGRSLLGLAVVQLAVKAVCPDQSIRLHKAGPSAKSFSWTEGIPMRQLDTKYIVPFMRKHDLLKLNKDGCFMTRSLAENYPYSRFYKAEIRGPKTEWLTLVDLLEADGDDAEICLKYLFSVLLRQSEEFKEKCEQVRTALGQARNVTMDSMERAVKVLLANSVYVAREFEIVLHSFMQALSDLDYMEGRLEPLSQMRSANKKHGNVADVEVTDGAAIREAWDAKYGKPYLEEELGELGDKLQNASARRVSAAGFVVDVEPDTETEDIRRAIAKLEAKFDVEVRIMSLSDWIEMQIKLNDVKDKDLLAQAWLQAMVESLTLARPELAPIDEPTGWWVEALTKTIRQQFK